jgi:hypothetical protein
MRIDLEKYLANAGQRLALAFLLLAAFASPAVLHAGDSAKPDATPAKADAAAAAAAPKAAYEPMSLLSDKDLGYGAESSFLTWHGYLNFEYSDKQGVPSTFDNHEFYLSAKASLSEKVSVTAEFEYEHNPGTLVLPIQAYADYAVHKAFNIRTGMFFTPMGIPRSYTLRGNRNRMIRQVALTHDIMFENWSEIGLNFFGQLKHGFFYDVAVGNGLTNSIATGDAWNQTARKDINGNKAVHSRFGYQTNRAANGSLILGVSAGTQKYDTLEQRTVAHRGFDVRYLHNSGWRFQAEFMNRTGDDNPTDLAKGIAAKAQGWYTQVSRRITFRNEQSFVEPVFQFDAVDLNRHVKDNKDLLTSAVGVVFSPIRHYQVKFEYDFVKERYGSPLSNNAAWAAVVVEF